ncbi:hypothetical protein BGLCM_0327 [Bifidobacterium gallicum DSM 20093 = LMG 11596]|nr:hypothetical protein BGLCM_0327 [Bifidobacterium gallicum DSM 20093 = LMG 11596]
MNPNPQPGAPMQQPQFPPQPNPAPAQQYRAAQPPMAATAAAPGAQRKTFVDVMETPFVENKAIRITYNSLISYLGVLIMLVAVCLPFLSAAYLSVNVTLIQSVMGYMLLLMAIGAAVLASAAKQAFGNLVVSAVLTLSVILMLALPTVGNSGRGIGAWLLIPAAVVPLFSGIMQFLAQMKRGKQATPVSRPSAPAGVSPVASPLAAPVQPGGPGPAPAMPPQAMSAPPAFPAPPSAQPAPAAPAAAPGSAMPMPAPSAMQPGGNPADGAAGVSHPYGTH